MLSLATFRDPAAVTEALSLQRGAKLRHGVDVLDGQDQPTGQRLRFESGWVRWSYRAPDRLSGQSGSVEGVRLTGGLVIPDGQPVNLHAVRLRVWTELQLLDGSWARFPRGTFTVVNPGAQRDDGMRVTRDVSLADKTHLWAGAFLPGPLTVAAGTVIVPFVQGRLVALGESRFALPGSTATLDQERTFETGLSELEVCNRLLEAGGLDQLTADELGRPTTRDLATLASKGPEHTYGPGEGKVVRAGQVEPLLPSLPNVVTFSARQGPSLGNVVGNGLAVRRNQTTGPASINSRGREVELRVSVEADSQAVLERIADADAQRYMAGGGLSWRGQVGLNPRHSDRDVIGLHRPALGLTSTDAWQVTEWTQMLRPVTDDSSVLMDVTAERRVALT